MSSPEAPERPVRVLRIEDWIDQDLTAAVAAGRLSPAFGRADAVRSKSLKDVFKGNLEPFWKAWEER